MASMLAYCLLAAATLSGPSCPTQDLARLRGQFHAATGARDKIELLTQIAALHVDETSDHAVTQAVVEALGDELRSVGARAADLLGAGLNTDLALDGLVEAASRFGDEQEKFWERERASGEQVEVADEDVLTRLKRRGDHFRDAARRVQDHAAYRQALMQALLLRRDDRCATGLGYLLTSQIHGDEAHPIVEGLLSLGTRPAVASVMDVFELHEQALKSRELQRKKIAGREPRQQPVHRKRTSTEWMDKERARLAAALEAFDMETRYRERWLKKITKRLRAFALEHDLPDAPRSSKRIQWKSWWRETRANLPANLTKDF